MGTRTPNIDLYLPEEGEGHPPAPGALDHDWAPDVNGNFSTIDTAVGGEIATRQAADAALQSALDLEAATRADTDDAEALARIAADSDLQDAIDAIDTGAGAALAAAIAAEVTDRTDADAAEATARGDADTVLTDNLAAEEAARIAADAELQTLIDALGSIDLSGVTDLIDDETTARTAADAVLQDQINDFVGGSGVGEHDILSVEHPDTNAAATPSTGDFLGYSGGQWQPLVPPGGAAGSGDSPFVSVGDYSDVAESSLTGQDTFGNYGATRVYSGSPIGGLSNGPAVDTVSVSPTGRVDRGVWTATNTYVMNDLVINAGASYVCILGHLNQQPPNATYWLPVSSVQAFLNTLADPPAASALYFNLPTPLARGAHAWLLMDVHSSDSERGSGSFDQQRNRFGVCAASAVALGGTTDKLRFTTQNFTGAWTTIALPLSAVTTIASVGVIQMGNGASNTRTRWYIDNIRLAASTPIDQALQAFPTSPIFIPPSYNSAIPQRPFILGDHQAVVDTRYGNLHGGVLRVGDYQIDSTGQTDVTDALVRLFSTLKDGDTLEFDPRGIYRINGNATPLAFNGDNITIDGRGARIRVTDLLERVMELNGRGSTLRNISIFGERIVGSQGSAPDVLRGTPALGYSRQSLSANGTAGTYTLTFNSQTTSAIPAQSSAATIQAALEALSSIGPNEAIVTGISPDFNVQFAGTLAGTTLHITGTSSLSGGGSPGVTITPVTRLLAALGDQMSVAKLNSAGHPDIMGRQYTEQNVVTFTAWDTTHVPQDLEVCVSQFYPTTGLYNGGDVSVPSSGNLITLQFPASTGNAGNGLLDAEFRATDSVTAGMSPTDWSPVNCTTGIDKGKAAWKNPGSLKLTCTAAGTMSVTLAPANTPIAGLVVDASPVGYRFSFRASKRGTHRTFRGDVSWYNSSGTFISTTQGTGGLTGINTKTGKRQNPFGVFSGLMIPPAGAAIARITITVLGCSIGDVEWIDVVSLSRNMTASCTQGRGRIGSGDVIVPATSGLSIGAADDTYDRIDFVAYSVAAGVHVIPGTPAAIPDYPSVAADTELVLASINVAANVITLTSSDVSEVNPSAIRIDTPDIQVDGVSVGATDFLGRKTLTLGPTPKLYTVNWKPKDLRARYIVTLRKATVTANSISIDRVQTYNETQYDADRALGAGVVVSGADCELDNVTVEGVGGDGVTLLGNSTAGNRVSDLLVRAAGRHCLGIIGGRNHTFRRVRLIGAGHWVMDVENDSAPDQAFAWNDALRLQDVFAYGGNFGGFSFSADERQRDFEFERMEVWYDEGHAFGYQVGNTDVGSLGGFMRDMVFRRPDGKRGSADDVQFGGTQMEFSRITVNGGLRFYGRGSDPTVGQMEFHVASGLRMPRGYNTIRDITIINPAQDAALIVQQPGCSVDGVRFVFQRGEQPEFFNPRRTIVAGSADRFAPIDVLPDTIMKNIDPRAYISVMPGSMKGPIGVPDEWFPRGLDLLGSSMAGVRSLSASTVKGNNLRGIDAGLGAGVSTFDVVFPVQNIPQINSASPNFDTAAAAAGDLAGGTTYFYRVSARSRFGGPRSTTKEVSQNIAIGNDGVGSVFVKLPSAFDPVGGTQFDCLTFWRGVASGVYDTRWDVVPLTDYSGQALAGSKANWEDQGTLGLMAPTSWSGYAPDGYNPISSNLLLPNGDDNPYYIAGLDAGLFNPTLDQTGWEPDALYGVFVSTTFDNGGYWITNKTVRGFTVNWKTATVGAAQKLSWMIVR